MTPSNPSSYSKAFVWIWLPGETTPVVAGKLNQEGQSLVFNYGQSYLKRKNSISLYLPELPLQSGVITNLNGLSMPGCLRDGSPDAWGRRVLINRKFGATGPKIDHIQLDELTFLLESGSDRIGALDFQLSATDYQARSHSQVSIEELIQSAERVEKGIPLTKELDQALYHGSPIGGARPKALIEETAKKKYIAKFSSTSDLYSVIKAEFIAMRLAKICGINTAEVQLKKSSNRDVLLVERFDRIHTSKGWERKCMVSALTLFELDEMMARYASYETLAEIIRHRFKDASKTLHELFMRMVFNVLVGNTDDHARNHAAFWDGKTLSLTPAYDICPQARSGNVASQAMLIDGDHKMSKISVCLTAARHFLLSRSEAIELTKKMIETIVSNWKKVCDLAEASPVDRKMFASRQFLNSYAFEGFDEDCKDLKAIAKSIYS